MPELAPVTTAVPAAPAGTLALAPLLEAEEVVDEDDENGDFCEKIGRGSAGLPKLFLVPVELLLGERCDGPGRELKFRWWLLFDDADKGDPPLPLGEV